MAETLLAYISSLQDQGIDGNSKPSIFELVEKWKTDNPDWNKEDEKSDEVKEEVVEEETIVDPFGLRPPNSILNEDFDPTEQIDVKPISEMSLGEMQTAIKEGEALEKFNEEVASIAQPSEIYDKHDNAYEYKYTISSNGPTYYTRRKGSDDEWFVYEKDSNMGFDIAAKVFKHVPGYSEEKAKDIDNMLSRSVLSSGPDKTKNYSYWKEYESKEIYDDLPTMRDLVPDYNVEVLNDIIEKHVKLTEDQKTQINEAAENFINMPTGEDVEMSEDEFLGVKLDKNGRVVSKSLLSDTNYNFSDNEKYNKQIQKFVKAGTHSYDPETETLYKLDKPHNTSDYYQKEYVNAQGDEFSKSEVLSSRDEILNLAATVVAQEQGLTAADLNMDDPETIIKIREKGKEIKLRELQNWQRRENIENFLQEDATDFNWQNAGIAWAENAFFGPTLVADLVLGDLYDRKGITDIWEMSKTNKAVYQYLLAQENLLSQKAQRSEAFIMKGNDFLKTIDKQMLVLRNTEYQTPAQASLANRQLKGYQKSKEETIDLMTQKYEEINEELAANPDLEGLINKAKRNYGYMPILVNNVLGSTADIGLNIANLVFEGFELFGTAVDTATDTFGTWGPALGFVSQTIGAVSPTIAQIYSAPYALSRSFGITNEEFTENKDKLMDMSKQWVEDTFRGTIAESKTWDETDGFTDKVSWTLATVGNVTPQIGAMAIHPVFGLSVIGASTAGDSKYRDEKEIRDSEAAIKKWDSNKPTKKEGETDAQYNNRLQDYINLNGERPQEIRFSELQMWSGALFKSGIEVGGNYLMAGLYKGKSLINPVLSRMKALNTPKLRSAWSSVFAQNLKKPVVFLGDSSLEGIEEVGVNMGTQWWDRYVMGRDVNIFDGNREVFRQGIVGGGMMNSIGLYNSYLNNVQTPADRLNISGLQKEIQSISEIILQNPDMSQVNREKLLKDIDNRIIDITNSKINSINIYTEISESDYNELGNIDQQLFRVNSQIESILDDEGIKVNKDQLVEDLQNKSNELSGRKNQILEPYVASRKQANKEVYNDGAGGGIVIPIVKMQAGADVVAEQLDSGIQRFDNTTDLIGAFTTLKEQGVNVNYKTDNDGNILLATEQDYGLIATLPDGTKQIIINEASSQADGVLPADKHEVLHLAAAKMDPAKKVQMGTDLLNSLENDPNIEISDRVRSLLDSYKKDLDDGNISEAEFYEEVMAVTSDGLTDGGVNIKNISLFKSIGDKILQTIGWKQNFDDGMGVINFLMDFNADVIKGEGLSQKVLDEVDMGLETEVDLGTVKSKKLPAETETYMELDNEVLQQGLNDALQNETDQRFPLAQAVVEKKLAVNK